MLGIVSIIYSVRWRDLFTRSLGFSIPQQIPADNQPHHLVGAFEDLVYAQVAQDALDWVIAQVAVAAVKLQTAIHHRKTGIGGKPLGHGGKPRCAALAPIEGVRRPVEHQARCLELGRIVSDAEAERLEISEPGAELLDFQALGFRVADYATE